MKVPWRSHHCDLVIKSWRSQFEVKDEKDTRIRFKELISFINQDSNSGDSFIINFLVAYATFMIDAPTMGTCNQKFLENLKENVSFKDLDWCGLFIECLRQSKCKLNMNRPSSSRISCCKF